MNEKDYSPEQRKDIHERVEKAKKMLLDLNLQPGVVMQPINLGIKSGDQKFNDVFAFQPISYLQDTKFTNIPSPLQQRDLQK